MRDWYWPGIYLFVVNDHSVLFQEDKSEVVTEKSVAALVCTQRRAEAARNNRIFNARLRISRFRYFSRGILLARTYALKLKA
jgi:hypothetical protein